MADEKSATADPAKRTLAILKLTGRNEEGSEPRTIGDAIHAVFADCSEAGSNGDLEETDPVVLQALDGWLSLDDALDELPTGTRDELLLFSYFRCPFSCSYGPFLLAHGAPWASCLWYRKGPYSP